MGNLEKNKFVLYETEQGKVNVNVVLKNETIWLTQKGMSELFNVGIPAISKHVGNIFETEELVERVVVSKMEITTKHGAMSDKNQTKSTNFYNLDMIIAVGYRVNSKAATKFRQWATDVLRDYIIKGYKLDKERLKNGPKFGKDYFKDLLAEIKEIRTSEYRVYRQILDIFEATSVDYDKTSEEAYTFFKIVQNKLHYAITGKTAAELIFERVDSEKDNMGLTTWKKAPDGKILKYDVSIAKNYLKSDELKKLQNLTNLFFDIAEEETENENVFRMNDWINITDDLLKYRKKEVLSGSGKISSKAAVEKAHQEYEIFKVRQDEKYISSMDLLYEKYLKED